MKATIENANNPHYHVGSMTTIPEDFMLSSPSATAKSNSSGNSDKVNYSPLSVGSNRQDCLTYLEQRNIRSISFAHWLAIPSLHLLLVFKGQRCVAVEHQLLTP